MQPLRVSYCEKDNNPCVGWVEYYFKDCLCNINDDISFGFGLASLIFWGVAEIPQIITNFNNKSGHGVSFTFLCTWIIGDIFNLAGCFLEPATLPTQLYTALLYTTMTLVLAFQSLYYDHFLRWWKSRTMEAKDEEKPLKSSSIDTERTIRNVPVEVPHRREYYFTNLYKQYIQALKSVNTPLSNNRSWEDQTRSARSLAGSATSPTHFYMKAKSGPPALVVNSDSSSEEDETTTNPSPQRSRPWRIPRSVGYGTFLAASANLPYQTRGFTNSYTALSGRKLLQENGLEDNVLGQWLGWSMAAIYMGGRIPQILLNIRRGSVEGLNPLMFILALLANATYTASILVRSTEWEKIKANMPWLLDAIACVALDLFIILQYIYYRYIHGNKPRSVEEY